MLFDLRAHTGVGGLIAPLAHNCRSSKTNTCSSDTLMGSIYSIYNFAFFMCWIKVFVFFRQLSQI